MTNNPQGFDRFPSGASQEVFEQSVYDLAAGITFLASEGFSEVVLIGNSTGANKVCFYAATKKDPLVKAVVLSSPLSDRLVPEKGTKLIQKTIKIMRRLAKQGKGNILTALYHHPITPNRYLSLYDPSSKEDMFDYGNKNPKMAYVSKIKLPLLVVFGEKDEYADRPITGIKAVFDQKQISPNYKSLIIEGGLHSFDGLEEDYAEAVNKWVKN